MPLGFRPIGDRPIGASRARDGAAFLWTKHGKILTDEFGNIISCPDCPCDSSGGLLRCMGGCNDDGLPLGNMKATVTFCGRVETFILTPNGGGNGSMPPNYTKDCCKGIRGTNQPPGPGEIPNDFNFSSLFQLCGTFGDVGLGITNLDWCCATFHGEEGDTYLWWWEVGLFADFAEEESDNPFPGIGRALGGSTPVDPDVWLRPGFVLVVDSATIPVHFTITATLDDLYSSGWGDPGNTAGGLAACVDESCRDEVITIEFYEDAP